MPEIDACAECPELRALFVQPDIPPILPESDGGCQAGKAATGDLGTTRFARNFVYVGHFLDPAAYKKTARLASGVYEVGDGFQRDLGRHLVDVMVGARNDDDRQIRPQPTCVRQRRY